MGEEARCDGRLIAFGTGIEFAHTIRYTTRTNFWHIAATTNGNPLRSRIGLEVCADSPYTKVRLLVLCHWHIAYEGRPSLNMTDDADAPFRSILIEHLKVVDVGIVVVEQTRCRHFSVETPIEFHAQAGCGFLLYLSHEVLHFCRTNSSGIVNLQLAHIYLIVGCNICHAQPDEIYLVCWADASEFDGFLLPSLVHGGTYREGFPLASHLDDKGEMCVGLNLLACLHGNLGVYVVGAGGKGCAEQDDIGATGTCTSQSET